jgi:hypothetical protein
MTTVINNPGGKNGGGDSSATLLIVVLVLLILGVLFFVYGFPGRSVDTGADINNAPEQVDVNVNSPQGNTGGTDETGGGAQY